MTNDDFMERLRVPAAVAVALYGVTSLIPAMVWTSQPLLLGDIVWAVLAVLMGVGIYFCKNDPQGDKVDSQQE